MVNKSLCVSNILICRQWWKVCWINGDREKIYRKLYRRRPTNGPASSDLLTLQIEKNVENKNAAPAEHISDDDSGCDLEEYTWIPPDIHPNEVRLYFAEIPEEKIPYVDSPGEHYRINQLVKQLPPQDSEAQCCFNLKEDEKKDLYLFSAQRMKDYLGRGLIKQMFCSLPCRTCQKIIIDGSICVAAERAGTNAVWHPPCFICCVCKELLVHLIYFFDKNQLFCGRHHAETLKPRCSACDEIIFSEKCIEAEGKAWHINHFVCYECNRQLGGKHYIMKDGLPCCLHCFDTIITEKCTSCGGHIKLNDGKMTYENQHWHASEKCFCCFGCGISLLGHPFLPKGGFLYCSEFCCKEELLENHNSVISVTKIQDTKQLFKCRESKITLEQSNFFSTKMNIFGSSSSIGNEVNDSSEIDKNGKFEAWPTNYDVPHDQFSEVENGNTEKLIKSIEEKQRCFKQRNLYDYDNTIDDEHDEVVIVPHRVIDIKETKLFQRSILKKYGNILENSSFEKKRYLPKEPESTESNEVGIKTNTENFGSHFVSEYERETISSCNINKQPLPKKQLKVHFQNFIPDIKYSDSPPRKEDVSDSFSTCSTCSSSSGEDFNTYILPQRREYGGIRISYIPNDAMACAKKQQEMCSRLDVKKAATDKHCVIS